MRRSMINAFQVLLIASAALVSASPSFAQFGPPPAPQGPARDIAPIDLTGQWVSIVTEDWRFRMVTPEKGDYPGLPLTPAGKAVADAWDPAKDEADGNECRSYGAPALMRVPGRVRISWKDASTLEIQADAGRQTRLLHFGDMPAAGAEPSWQGVSHAEWVFQGGGRGRPPTNGSLKVVTTGLKEGYLHKNGVPYSSDAVLTEYFDLLHEPDGSQWLVVKAIVDDLKYYTQSPITSSNFRKQKDRSGWDPEPCTAR